MSSTYIEPHNFADHLSNQRDYYLFVDIDGTLADFTLDPKDSVIPCTTLALLQDIQNCGVKIAAVTGRSLIEARQMLSPLILPIAATHGLEMAFDGIESKDDKSVAPVDNTELTAIKQAVFQSCITYNDFTIETKPYSIALHYRQNPALADLAFTIMSDTLKPHNNWALKQGKYVYEAVPKGANKGTAILTLLENTQANDNVCAIFIGDDLTDEAGFMAIQGQLDSIDRPLNDNHKPAQGQKILQGIGIKVGNEPTCARYYIKNTHEVTVLLKSFLAFCQENLTPARNLADATLPTTKKSMRYVI